MSSAPSINEAAKVFSEAGVEARRDALASERARIRALAANDRKLGILFKSIWRGYRPMLRDPREYIEREWSRKLPKVYERMLAATLAGERVPEMAFDVLKAMTVMCRTLAPQANKQLPADPTVLGLPSDADLSHLSDEELARVLRRPMPNSDTAILKQARKAKRALPAPDGVDAADSKDGATIAAMSNGRTNGEPWGGLDDDDDGTRSGNPHTPESKVSKGGKKK